MLHLPRRRTLPTIACIATALILLAVGPVAMFDLLGKTT